MTSKLIYRLLETNASRRGSVAYHQAVHAMRGTGADRRRGGIRPSYNALLTAIESQEAPPRKAVRHPADAARPVRSREHQDLTTVELEWLRRLPLDPAAVTFSDATALAELASSISEMHAPASARLVNGVWEPVKALHDRRVARAELDQALRLVPSIPREATDALADALRQELGELHPETLGTEASRRLREWKEAFEEQRRQRIAKAEAAVKGIDDRSARAADTTGDVA